MFCRVVRWFRVENTVRSDLVVLSEHVFCSGANVDIQQYAKWLVQVKTDDVSQHL